MADPKKSEEKKADAKPDGNKPADLPGPIPNKAGEPDFKLQLEPDRCAIFKSDELLTKPCILVWALTNNTGKRQVFKVKCSSNEVFRVTPPLGFVDDKQTVKVQVICMLKEMGPTRHFFAVYHTVPDKDVKTARAAWTPETKPDGVRRLPCLFLKNDGTPWTVDPNAPPKDAGAKDSKKKDDKKEEKKEEKKPEEKKEAKKEDKKEEKKEEGEEEKKEEAKEEKKEEKDEKKKEEKKEEKKKDEKPAKK
ncbi:unnamed protein product [Bursaphelenchus xylophilus]|uniref:Major sperm protein n=1 Tax=Bursaphelenchus xylophilus TaxID=6326 RepID=A0A1I7S9P7_BURXY|nr:unnamed protein product [Bursaphelenchus xylophilus]CAG9131904.1 unnamed protein product [Bursaphelenchus xylophilus]